MKYLPMEEQYLMEQNFPMDPQQYFSMQLRKRLMEQYHPEKYFSRPKYLPTTMKHYLPPMKHPMKQYLPPKTLPPLLKKATTKAKTLPKVEMVKTKNGGYVGKVDKHKFKRGVVMI
jgi:hypothetical protein